MNAQICLKRIELMSIKNNHDENNFQSNKYCENEKPEKKKWYLHNFTLILFQKNFEYPYNGQASEKLN